MTRKRYIQIDGVLHEVTDDGLLRDPRAPFVMPDIAPYQSMIDGSLISSRSRHREHLRDNGCIEIGNEIPGDIASRDMSMKSPNPEQLRGILRAQFDAMTHEEFKRAKARDLETIRWNSRKD